MWHSTFWLPETLWPSGLRRWLKAPFRKGVGSNPTGVILMVVGEFTQVVFDCGVERRCIDLVVVVVRHPASRDLTHNVRDVRLLGCMWVLWL